MREHADTREYFYYRNGRRLKPLQAKETLETLFSGPIAGGFACQLVFPQPGKHADRCEAPLTNAYAPAPTAAADCRAIDTPPASYRASATG
jgi:hypothetical protein